jgi:hypothetical protein
MPFAMNCASAALPCPATRYGFLKRREISLKKPCSQPSRTIPDIARRRLRWKKYQPRFGPSRLVFIDENRAKTNMTRTGGWCRRGKPLVAKVPHGHWKTLTFLAALRHDAITAPSCWTAH